MAVMLLEETELIQRPYIFAIMLAWMHMLVAIFKSNEFLFGGLRLWHASASLRKNENGICTQAEIQAVAKFWLIIICKS